MLTVYLVLTHPSLSKIVVLFVLCIFVYFGLNFPNHEIQDRPTIADVFKSIEGELKGPSLTEEEAKILLSQCKQLIASSRIDLETKELKERLYVITPTYPRYAQIAELTRLGQTLQHVQNLIWIVAEDAKYPTEQAPMPDKYRNLINPIPSGVENRNRALAWISKKVEDTGDDSGVIYFADDDNTYDLRLFEEIRKTKTVSMFPVGLFVGGPISSPVLDKNGTFLNFYDTWIGNRKYPLDMAGFAVSVQHFVESNKKKHIEMAYIHAYEEDSFLKQLEVDMSRVQFLADNCTKIYVWHTQTKKSVFKKFDSLKKNLLNSTNFGSLNKYWCLYINNQTCP